MTEQQTTMEQAKPHAAAGTASLWAGVLGAPAAWGLQFEINYALVPWICGHGWRFLIPLISAIFIAIGIATFVLTWREWSKVRSAAQSDDQAGEHGREYFLAILGLMVSGLFTIVIVAQGLAVFFLNPCWD